MRELSTMLLRYEARLRILKSGLERARHPVLFPQLEGERRPSEELLKVEIETCKLKILEELKLQSYLKQQRQRQSGLVAQKQQKQMELRFEQEKALREQKEGTREIAEVPAYAERLLYLSLPPKDADGLIGDLTEEFHEITKKHGETFAVGWYWWQTFTSIGPIIYSRLTKLAKKTAIVGGLVKAYDWVREWIAS